MGRGWTALSVLAAAVLFFAAIPAGATPLKPGLMATRRLVDLATKSLESKLADRDPAAPSSVVTCDACKIIVGALDYLFMENKTQDEIVEVITDICIGLHIEDRNVCTLVVKEFQVHEWLYAETSLS